MKWLPEMRTGVIGYDARIKNKRKLIKWTEPKAADSNHFTEQLRSQHYCSRSRQDYVYSAKDQIGEDTYSKLFYEIKERAVSNRKRGLHRCVEIIDFIVMINLYLFGEIILN